MAALRPRKQNQVLKEITTFCRPRGAATADGIGEAYAFVHQSFTDWITNEEKSEDYFVEETKGHVQLAERALFMLHVQEGRRGRLRSPAADVAGETKSGGRNDKSSISDAARCRSSCA